MVHPIAPALFGAQHAPNGGQSVGLHAVFAPFHEPKTAVHCACVTTTHGAGLASGELGPRQHAPVGAVVPGHAPLAPHTEPAPKKTPPP